MILHALPPLPAKASPLIWCVPSAYSILTGAPLAGSHQMFAFRSGGKFARIGGVEMPYLLTALAEVGKTCTPVDLPRRYPSLTYGPKLYTYMAERATSEERAFPLLVLFSDHVVVAHMDWVCDNTTRRPVHVDTFYRRTSFVNSVWVVR